jgi:hypothetical protein
MNLQDIRELRMQRVKPSGVIALVVGKVPAWHRSHLDVIQVLPGSQPQLSDWRPLVGLWVAVYETTKDAATMAALGDALDKAGAKLFGVVLNGVAHALAKFPDEQSKQQAEFLMADTWSDLCK